MPDRVRSGLEAEWVVVAGELAKVDPTRMRRLLDLAYRIIESHGGKVGEAAIGRMAAGPMDLSASSDLL